ncbi:hypothetical protein Tco_0008083 [Tanacetum coccineum]
MTTLADKSLLSGGDNKPPMLEKHLYDSWKSRMELYMMNRPHGRMILASVEKGSLVWPTITVDGVTYDHIIAGSNPSVLVDKTKSARDGLKTAHTTSGENKTSRADDISRKVKPKDLSDILKDTRSAFFTPDSPIDEPIIVLNESEEDEEVAKDKDTEDTSFQKEELEQAKVKAEAEVASMKSQRPSYSNINQLTKLSELPSKITELSGEIKELKQHVRDMEIELPRDLVEIPTKLETFTSTISSLSSQVAELKNIQWKLPTEFLNLPSQVSSVQEKLQTLDSLPSLLHKETDTLNKFSTMVDNASGATSMHVPSLGQTTTSPAEGEKEHRRCWYYPER